MGEVYRADDLRLGQAVALKFLPADWVEDPQHRASLHEEVRLARQISHPHVCRVHDIAEAEGQPFLSMEFIDGEDLASLLRRIGRLPSDKGIQIARQLCLGLAAAHEKGVIHRDLKPANVMLDGRGQVRITDFGLARLAEAVAGSEACAGTPAYMAPEQLAGKEVTVRSDLYALGLVLYEVFTGKRAFQASSRAELVRMREQSAPASPSSHVTDLDPTVERVILRCLEKEPRQRPPSALAVLAALPGGDPLAAALALGETPSPEIVAAARDPGVWPTCTALACLAGALAALVGCVLLSAKATLVGRVGMPEPPEVLARIARDTLEKKLGFEPARDRASGFDHDEAYLRWIQREDPSPYRWDRLEQPQPAALFFWYRQSPEPLAPDQHYPYQGTLEPGRITLAEPPPVIPGMVGVRLDLHGRLLYLHAVPPDRDSPAGNRQAPDWKALFDAAELELGQFEETTPTQTPPSFADQRKAWIGDSPHAPNLPIRVEAATFQGRPVFFQILGPRMEREHAVGSHGTLDRAGLVLSALLFTAVLIAAAFLAPHNWKLGRADRKGAFRLAFGSFLLLLVVWLFETHHVLSLEELRLLVLGLAFALYWAGLLWLTYLALEPYVRRLWPECLITWTRLLAGQWRDPRLGRDVLLGSLVGMLVGLLDLLGRVLPAWLGGRAPAPYWDWWIPNTFVRGYWVGNFLINLVYSFRYAFFFNLLLFLLLRTLLKRPAPAFVGYVLLQTAFYVGTNAGFEPSWYWLFAVLLEVLIAWLLIRVGVLAVIVTYFSWYCVCFPLTTDLRSWCAQDSLLALGAVVVLAVYGFYTSLAGRSLFRDEVLAR